MVRAEIVNVVATASLKQEMDFEELRKSQEIRYDSNVYGGRVAYFKRKNMEGSVSIFSSGKMIGVGTKSESKAYCELDLTMKFLAERGFAKSVELDKKIRNIVVTADFEKKIDLESFSKMTRAIYEPEQFPGTILRLMDPCKASILVFASGKVVIAGLTSSTQIKPIIERLKRLIERARAFE